MESYLDLVSFSELLHNNISDSTDIVKKIKENEIIQIYTYTNYLDKIVPVHLKELLELFEEIDLCKNKMIRRSKRMKIDQYRKMCTILLTLIDKLSMFDIDIPRHVIQSSRKNTWLSFLTDRDQKCITIQNKIWNKYIKCYSNDNGRIPDLNHMNRLLEKFKYTKIPPIFIMNDEDQLVKPFLHIHNMNIIIEMIRNPNYNGQFYPADPCDIPKSQLLIELSQRYVHAYNELEDVLETKQIFEQSDEIENKTSFQTNLIRSYEKKLRIAIQSCHRQSINVASKIYTNDNEILINNVSLKDYYAKFQKDSKLIMKQIQKLMIKFYDDINSNKVFANTKKKSLFNSFLVNLLTPSNIALMDRMILK